MLVGAVLPFSPIGPAFGFTPLPLLYWPLVAATLLGYVLLTGRENLALSDGLSSAGQGVHPVAFSFSS
jgi:hypothetical protein